MRIFKVLSLGTLLLIMTSTLGQHKKSDHPIEKIKLLDSLSRKLDMAFDFHFCLNDSSFLITDLRAREGIILLNDTASLKMVCDSLNQSPNLVSHIISVMKNNRFYSSGPAGPGDCAGCSRYVALQGSLGKTGYVVENPKHYCYPKDCYELLDSKRLKYLKNDVMYVKPREPFNPCN